MATRDYKSSRAARSAPRSAPRRGKSGGGLGSGIVIGLIVGVGVAAGTVYYLNRSALPFSEKVPLRPAPSAPASPQTLAPGTQSGTAPEVVPSIPGSQTLPPPDRPEAAAPAEPVAPNYDFYQLLADKDGKLPAERAPAAVPASPPPAKKAPAEDSKPAEGKPAAAATTGKKVFFQLGAFARETEADNLKARLALSGVEASISSVEVADKGLLHRVRIGPYSKPEDIARVKAMLKQDGFNPVVVKAD
ncbi:MAG: SPOR domain-containing protein [Laribacter sp.]|nr:SPOR domain-containing protein [Laribacter sp.]MBP9526965.1 SPOR domain-containing protein [Laribacter sp.]MBP9608155.1 SPOR domain-containing protein [Laribacter sp.]